MVIEKLTNFDFANYIGFEVLNGPTFLSVGEISEVYDACSGKAEMLYDLFNRIGIKYDNISEFRKGFVSYTVNNVELSLSELSSGERYLLYLLACKVLDRKIIARSLFERLGNRLSDVVYNELRDYDGLIILLSNAELDFKFKPYREDLR